MKRINSALLGIILLGVSVVLALNAFHITDINIFFDGWWTLFIIIPSLVGICNSHDKTANVVGLLIGVFLLLACQDILSFSMIWKLAAPVIIAVIGIKLILGGAHRNSGAVKCIEANGYTKKTACAVFSGQDIVFDNEAFGGADFTSIFGGIKCDLRNAVFTSDTVINACCIFGGMDIFLPDNVNLKVNSDSIFGGIDNKKHQNTKDNQYTVHLNGTCIFGGVDVK